mmetsp:Transcript_28069/g.73480  ORF Transcript_28069/g.73480 Transcript_28069/m.73480 type:complete len:200 (-) Transcript_28069:78-677(-)
MWGEVRVEAKRKCAARRNYSMLPKSFSDSQHESLASLPKRWPATSLDADGGLAMIASTERASAASRPPAGEHAHAQTTSRECRRCQVATRAWRTAKPNAPWSSHQPRRDLHGIDLPWSMASARSARNSAASASRDLSSAASCLNNLACCSCDSFIAPFVPHLLLSTNTRAPDAKNGRNASKTAVAPASAQETSYSVAHL